MSSGSNGCSQKTVLVIGIGVESTSKAMFEMIYRKGVRTIAVDYRDHDKAWIASLVPSGIVDKLVTVPGLWDAAQTEELATSVIQKLADAGVDRIDAVYNVYYHYLLLATRVAKRLGCITNPLGAIETCLAKSRTRTALIAAGLESWCSFSFQTMRELEEIASLMKYPAVLKPAEASGSYGVVKVASAHDTRDQFLKLKAEHWYASDQVEFILEEYIDGPEFGVEIIMQEGNVLFGSIMDVRKQDNSIYFQGTGRSFPSSQPMNIQEATLIHCFSAVKTLGLTTGVLDIDVRYSSSQQGPRIIEVNPRMGGGSVTLMHKLAYGINLEQVILTSCLGLDLSEEIPSIADGSHSQYLEAGWVMSPRSGVLGDISSFVNSLQLVFAGDPCIKSIEALQPAGTEVVGYSDGLPTCLIQVMATAASKSLALQHLQLVIQTAEEHLTSVVRGQGQASVSDGCSLYGEGLLRLIPLMAFQAHQAHAVKVPHDETQEETC